MEAELPVACPRCGVAMFVGETPMGSVRGCGRCGGIWLGTTASQRLTQTLCDRTLFLAESVARSAQPVHTQGPIACPVCAQPLQQTFLSNARVELDVCQSHGTWFDRNELESVARAFAAERAYRGTVGAVAAAAVVGTEAPGGGRAMQLVEDHGEDAVEVGVEALDWVDAGDVAEGAGIAAEVGSGLAEGAFELLGGLFDAF
ncbi:MAG: zf-TFIIB domain-containing protein [Polyangiaceae bacterium]